MQTIEDLKRYIEGRFDCIPFDEPNDRPWHQAPDGKPYKTLMIFGTDEADAVANVQRVFDSESPGQRLFWRAGITTETAKVNGRQTCRVRLRYHLAPVLKADDAA